MACLEGEQAVGQLLQGAEVVRGEGLALDDREPELFGPSLGDLELAERGPMVESDEMSDWRQETPLGRSAVPRSIDRIAPKPKVEVAREHSSKAEVAAGDLKDAIQWSFASLEAAIDALAEQQEIGIEEQHWRRRDAARALHASGVLPQDLSSLHQLPNEERKAMFYDGEDPDLGELSIQDVLVEVETAVRMAEAESK